MIVIVVSQERVTNPKNICVGGKAWPDMKVFPLQVQMGNDPVQPQMSK